MDEKTFPIKNLSRQSTRLRTTGLLLLFLSFVALIIITTNQLGRIWDAKNEHLSDEKQIDSLRMSRDSIRVEVIQAKGYDIEKRRDMLSEGLKANDLIPKMLKSHKIDTSLTIKYYRKSLDQQKIWLSLQELGYKKLIEAESTKASLLDDETNTIVVGNDVQVDDIKLIALTLIRAGFKVEHIYISQRNAQQKKIVQIISTSSPNAVIPISLEKIEKAKSVDEILH